MNPTGDDAELIAYLDGELPAARRGEIERRLATDARLQKMLRDLQSLRSRSHDVVRSATPTPSDTLRARVQAIADAYASATEPVSAKSKVESIVLPRRAASVTHRWWAAAAAIVLLTSGVTWLTLRETRTTLTPGRVILRGLEASGLTPQAVSMLDARHVKCVMMGNNFADPTFPQVLADVSPAVREYLGEDVVIPDLSSIGLKFAGVGPCEVPGGKTLHWLYLDPAKPELNFSVFVQPYNGQVAFGVDQAVVVAGPTPDRPILVWRTNTFVYYLLGDDFPTASRAAAKLGVSFGA